MNQKLLEALEQSIQQTEQLEFICTNWRDMYNNAVLSSGFWEQQAAYWRAIALGHEHAQGLRHATATTLQEGYVQ